MADMLRWARLSRPYNCPHPQHQAFGGAATATPSMPKGAEHYEGTQQQGSRREMNPAESKPLSSGRQNHEVAINQTCQRLARAKFLHGKGLYASTHKPVPWLPALGAVSSHTWLAILMDDHPINWLLWQGDMAFPSLTLSKGLAMSTLTVNIHSELSETCLSLFLLITTTLLIAKAQVSKHPLETVILDFHQKVALRYVKTLPKDAKSTMIHNPNNPSNALVPQKRKAATEAWEQSVVTSHHQQRQATRLFRGNPTPGVPLFFTLAPQGDLVLTAPAHDGVEFKFLVDSTLTRDMSAVFTDVLKDWAVSHTRYLDAELRVNADAEALLIFLYVEYGVQDKTPRIVSLVQLAGIADLLLRYGVVPGRALCAWAKLWFRGILDAQRREQPMVWLWVTYVFELGDAFKDFTAYVIRTSVGRVDSSTDRMTVPAGVIDAIEAQRIQQITLLLSILFSFYILPPNPRNTCPCALTISTIINTTLYAHPIPHIHPEPPYPLLSHTILIRALEDIQSRVEKTNGFMTMLECRCGKVVELDMQIKVAKKYEFLRGLKLDGFRERVLEVGWEKIGEGQEKGGKK
ncbi:hypothetical protein AJ80_02947 [Polytolypa hystricis UAMH7299]|uniref:BTB domain-containing protein n=1 Tax=Polytolypa hystricis (strain UAMH7299) TaxID=1447883 RepID=A0A2B7YQ96_POLH7|nr:hypothetical protein AJ80_02947 [Polytolypa hystricis UAMH7299]